MSSIYVCGCYRFGSPHLMIRNGSIERRKGGKGYIFLYTSFFVVDLIFMSVNFVCIYFPSLIFSIFSCLWYFKNSRALIIHFLFDFVEIHHPILSPVFLYFHICLFQSFIQKLFSTMERKCLKGHLIPQVSFINISGSGKLLIIMCVKEADCVRVCI